MDRTKIFLADLAHTHSVDDRSLTVPLSIGYVKAYAVERFDDAVDIRLFKHPERFLSALQDEQPAIVGFANYGWNANLNRDIGAYTRRLLPDALIVAGGPNIDPEAAQRRSFLNTHSYVDYLIIDGGEQPFAELVEWHLSGTENLGTLPSNLVWLDNGAIRATEERQLKKIIDDIPSPYLNGSLDEFLAAGMVPLFETNRGCPFQCTFCAWGSASKDLVRRMDIETALAEISYVGDRSDAVNWIICDANFGILKRDVEIADAIRAVRDRKGRPHKCHVWLAKNVTERNLEIGAILGDMTVPVMAVQSLDEAVLKNIKRDNISIDTYAEYQRKFHSIGSRTYSDLIVPLPGEDLETHLAGLRQLFELGVDIIQNHNMRLLAGAQTNDTDTRERYGFRVRYRLIHGDAGEYACPDGTTIRTFEYEESLRETTTMSEDDLFYLRKLHFLVDFCWNIEAYKPLLKVAQLYGTNPLDILSGVLDERQLAKEPKVAEFFRDFENRSRCEWYDSAEEIERHFADDRNFARLIAGEFEKLNVLGAVMVLKECKVEFDALISAIAREAIGAPDDVLAAAERIAFSSFPPLSEEAPETQIDLPRNFFELDDDTVASFRPSAERRTVRLEPGPRRARVREMIVGSQGHTLSKILNTQSVSIADLRLTMPLASRGEEPIRRAV